MKKARAELKSVASGLWRGIRLTVLLAALIFTVAGSRLLLIDRQAIDLPYLDQWSAEWSEIIKPHLEGKLDWRSFFQPHNEHRIVWTKLLALGLFLENGQWDGKLEMVANLFLQVAVGTGLFLIGYRWFVGASVYVWWMVVALAFALPFGYDNTLVGFQSQFYLMSGFSVWLGWLATRLQPRSWWQLLMILFCGGMLLFSMGSGFLAAATLLAVLGFSAWRNDGLKLTGSTWRREIWVMVILLGIMVAGLKLLNQVHHHDSLRPTSMLEFCHAAARCFAWPWSRLSQWPVTYLLALILWLPWVAYVIRLAWDREKTLTTRELMVLFLGGWAALQMTAMAASRGAMAAPPASRYADTIVFGLIGNFLALWHLPLHQWRKWGHGLGLAWLAVAGGGLISLTTENIQVDLPERFRQFQAQQRNVINFLRDNDVKHLTNKPFNEVPLVGVEDLLRDPVLRKVLPFGVREELPLVEEQVASAEDMQGFVENGLPSDFPPSASTWKRGSFVAENGGTKNKGGYRATFEAAGNFPYIALMVSGHLDESGSQLTVRPPKKKKQILQATTAARGSWQPVMLKASRSGTYELVAKDSSISRWLAFTSPKEVGRLSVYALKLLQYADWYLGIGLGLVLLLASAEVWRCSTHASEARQQVET